MSSKVDAGVLDLTDRHLAERVTWHPVDNNESRLALCLTDDVHDSYEHHGFRPAPATLSVTARISDDEFHLFACGGWDPNDPRVIEWRKPFLKARAHAWVQDPEPDGGDFATARENLLYFIDQIPEARRGYKGLIERRWGSTRFMIGQRVFEESYRVESYVPYQDLPEFQIQAIPLVHEAARPHHNAISRYCTFLPIPAFSSGSKVPIYPTQYEEELKGKLVRIKLSLNFYNFNAPTFTANIVDIRIIEPPPILKTPTRMRKRAALTSFPDEEEDVKPVFPVSPTKKRRTVHKEEP